MYNYMRKYFNLKLLTLLVLMLVFGRTVKAEISFTAATNIKTVAVGESFQLIYTLNTSGKDLRLPQLEGFSVIAGPFQSTSSSVQYVNGSMTSSKTVRFTYTLLAEKVGAYTIKPASVVANKQKVFSNAVNLKVIPEEEKSNPQSQSTSQQQGHAATNISSDNLYVKAFATKTKVKEQEAVMLTYKIYARVELVDIQSMKFPDLKSLLVQEIGDRQITQDRENVNGKNYNTYVINQYLVFPQQNGKIEIEPFVCDAVVRIRQQSNRRDIFGGFFDSYQDVKRSLKSNKIVLDVDALPSPKPIDFSGAVGKFSLSSEISTQELKENESLTLKYTINGVGNIKLIKNPNISFPTDFEAYEPKVNNNFKASSKGMVGSKTVEYLVIPRHRGEYTIPSYTFTYYDVDKNQYVSLSTKDHNVTVHKGDAEAASTVMQGSVVNQESVKVIATDIRYITHNECDIKEGMPYFAGTLAFWLSHVVALLLAGALLLIFRKQVKESANLALMRNKKANKVALKRLKVAKLEMQKANKEQFYDEILKALWGYLCDKFTIPVSELNKENVEAELVKRSVSQDEIDIFIALLKECEFQRYAPLVNKEDAMDKTYQSTMQLITNMENSIKR